MPLCGTARAWSRRRPAIPSHDYGRLAREVLDSHAGITDWGRSDCVTLVREYIRAYRPHDLPERVLPEWAQRKDGGRRSQASIIARAERRYRDAAIGRGWSANTLVALRLAWEEALDAIPVLGRLYPREVAATREALPGRLAVTGCGDLAVGGPDCSWWYRTEGGLSTTSYGIEAVWEIARAWEDAD